MFFPPFSPSRLNALVSRLDRFPARLVLYVPACLSVYVRRRKDEDDSLIDVPLSCYVQQQSMTRMFLCFMPWILTSASPPTTCFFLRK